VSEGNGDLLGNVVQLIRFADYQTFDKLPQRVLSTLQMIITEGFHTHLPDKGTFYQCRLRT
jgi:hypothetical protein